MERGCSKRHASLRVENNLRTEPLFMETWMQKPGHSCLWEKSVRVQEDEELYRHSWKKWVMMMCQWQSIFKRCLLRGIINVSKGLRCQHFNGSIKKRFLFPKIHAVTL